MVADPASVLTGFLIGVLFAGFVFLLYRGYLNNRNFVKKGGESLGSPLLKKEAPSQSPDAAAASVSKSPSKTHLEIKAQNESNSDLKSGVNLLGVVVGVFFITLAINAFLLGSEAKRWELALAFGVMQTLSGGLFGFSIKLLLDRMNENFTASVGRTWGGWGILIAGMSEGSFFVTFYSEDLARLIVAILMMGGVAFLAGEIFRKVRDMS